MAPIRFAYFFRPGSIEVEYYTLFAAIYEASMLEHDTLDLFVINSVQKSAQGDDFFLGEFLIKRSSLSFQGRVKLRSLHCRLKYSS